MLKSLIILLLTCTTVTAQVYNIRTSTGSGMDATTWTNQASTNHGVGSLQIASSSWSGVQGTTRVFLKFDLSSLPTGYFVSSAKLSMYGIPGGLGHSGNNASIISRVVQPWQEHIITWNNSPATTSTASVVAPGITGSQPYNRVDITQMVRTMYSHPDSNMGLMVRLQQEVPYAMLAFASKEWSDSTLHPFLEIELDTVAPPPPPPPSSLSFGLRTSTGSGMDATTWTNQASTNHGVGSLQIASSSWSGVQGTTRVFLKFDLSSLPTGYFVSSAKLSMYGIPGGLGHSGNNASIISRVVQPWQEHIITWNNSPATTSTASVVAPGITGSQPYNRVDITQMVRTMYSHPDSNMGLMVRLQQEVPYAMLAFASKEWSDSTLHPFLEIELDTIAPPPPPPPPSSLSFGIRTSTGSGMDATTWTNQASTNHGVGSLQIASSSWSGVQGTTRVFLKFDLSSLPTGYFVSSAKLSMYGIPGGLGHSGNNASIISRVVQPWQEHIITWNNSPATTSTASVVAPGITGSQPYNRVDITQMVRTMYSHPDSNMGLMVRLQQEVPYAMLAFASKEWSDSTLHPFLEIELDTIAPPPPPPPPSSLSFGLRTSTGSGMDATTWTNQASTNHGVGSLQVAQSSWGSVTGTTHAYLKFDMSSLPVGLNVLSARLTMFTMPGGIGHYGDNASIISRVVQPWQEHIITWNNAPAVSAVDSVHIPGITAFQQYSQIDITSMIRTMYAHPDSNMGLMIRLQQDVPYPFSMLMFASKEWSDSSLHPLLEIELDTTGIPIVLSTTINSGGILGKVYPNPAQNQFYFAIDEEIDLNRIFIFDQHGRKLQLAYQLEAPGLVKINTEQLPDGFYMLRYLTTSGGLVSKKLIIRH